MTEKLFETALGISAPWYVAGADFNAQARTLTIQMTFAAAARLIGESRHRVATICERFWAKLRTFVADARVGEGAVARDELSFAEITNSPAEALRFIEARLAT